MLCSFFVFFFSFFFSSYFFPPLLLLFSSAGPCGQDRLAADHPGPGPPGDRDRDLQAETRAAGQEPHPGEAAGAAAGAGELRGAQEAVPVSLLTPTLFIASRVARWVGCFVAHSATSQCCGNKCVFFF